MRWAPQIGGRHQQQEEQEQEQEMWKEEQEQQQVWREEEDVWEGRVMCGAVAVAGERL